MGGKSYQSSISSLLSIEDSFFYQYIYYYSINHNDNPPKEIVINKLIDNFDLIIHALNYANNDLPFLSKKGIKSFIEDINYLNIQPLYSKLNSKYIISSTVVTYTVLFYNNISAKLT